MTLELRSLSKSFPGVKALDDVSITFQPGEIHALLGENGAGKSTVIRAICGIHRPDQGEILLDGKALMLNSLHDGLEYGITIVNQELQVFSESSVAENIMMDKLGRYARNGRIDWATMNADALRFLKMVGLDIAPDLPIGPLSAAKKQLIQIAKALSREASVILLDEPTSSITSTEAQKLFVLLKALRDKGVTLIFVSHKIEEVLQICDVVTVLRDGRRIDTKRVADMTRDKIIQMMVGRSVLIKMFPVIATTDDNITLEARNLRSPGKVEDASFRLRRSEILGFYGVVGSGRTELAKVLIGHFHKTGGEVLIGGKSTNVRSVEEALRDYRIGYISESRKEDGLFLDFDIETNITVTIWRRLANRFTRAIDGKQQARVSNDLVKALDVRTTGIGQRVSTLSGGNQQKISIAKWLAADCDIIIIDEPTAGVDVGGKSAIHDLIWKLAYEGKSVILISSDMPEMISLASRILVFKNQSIVGEVRGLEEGARSYEIVSSELGALMA